MNISFIHHQNRSVVWNTPIAERFFPGKAIHFLPSNTTWSVLCWKFVWISRIYQWFKVKMVFILERENLQKAIRYVWKVHSNYRYITSVKFYPDFHIANGQLPIYINILPIGAFVYNQTGIYGSVYVSSFGVKQRELRINRQCFSAGLLRIRAPILHAYQI